MAPHSGSNTLETLCSRLGCRLCALAKDHSPNTSPQEVGSVAKCLRWAIPGVTSEVPDVRVSIRHSEKTPRCLDNVVGARFQQLPV